MRLLFFTLLCGLFAAQQSIPQQAAQTPQQPPKEQSDQQPEYRIPVTVDYVQTPVLVFDRSGGYVSNIRPEQFHLYDNDKEQNISVDVSYTPISLVILVQANAHVDRLLPQVNRIGNLIGPQVIGDAGEAAVIAYDSRIRTLQDFTTDKDKITEAVKKIQPGSESSRMVDAVVQGVRMLRTRPHERRRIILLIGETRDMGSESRTRDALVDLQMNNVIFYSVDMSRFVNALTAPRTPARPDPLPPAMTHVPSNVPATPTTVAQMYGTNATVQGIPLIMEIFRDAKAVFKSNPSEIFTTGTGGSEFGFHDQRTLESALTDLGEQLHSEYTLSYTPTDRETAGFHTIRVEVGGHAEIEKVVARPGYYLGALR